MIVETTSYSKKNRKKISWNKKELKKIKMKLPYYIKDVGNTIRYFEAKTLIVKTSDNKEFF